MFGLACLASIPGACQTGNAGSPVPTLTLNDAVQTALANNRQLQASAQEIGQAADATASARTELFPVLHLKATGGALLSPLDVRVPTGSLGTVNHAPFPTADSSIFSAWGGLGLLDASLAQPLTQLPVIRLNIRLKQVGVRAAQEQQRERAQAVVSAVKQTYFEILGAQDGLAAAQQALVYDQETERAAGDFVAHRTALQADLLDAQAQTAQQTLTLTELHDTITDAEERLNVLLGRDPAMPFAVELPADSPLPNADPDTLRALALNRRPDVREAALRAEQADLGKRIAGLPNLPAVSLVLSDNQLVGNINGFPHQLAILGLQLDWMPMDWGRRTAEQDRRAGQVVQAKASLQDAQAQALLDVNAKTRQYAEARARLSVAQAGQRAALERLREMTNQYKDKAILLKDVLQQQAASAAADARVQQALVQVLAAQAALGTAVGDDN
jgi:outer membrane protein TolC